MHLTEKSLWCQMEVILGATNVHCLCILELLSMEMIAYHVEHVLFRSSASVCAGSKSRRY